MSWDQVWRWICKTHTTGKKTICILEVTDGRGNIKKYSTLNWNKQFVYGFKEWNFLNNAGKVFDINISITKIMLRYFKSRFSVTNII